MKTVSKKRIESIDILRGIVMVLMALDHTRDFFHITAWTDDPLNLETTTPVLFFTRFVTHYCAPIFVFLSGVSIYLQSLRKSKSELSSFLIKRGLWLIFIELAIVSVGWSYDLGYANFPLQVIWVIGISMVILGLMIHLPFKAILGVGLLFVLGHNVLDFVEASADFQPNFWWDLLHHGNFVTYSIIPNHSFLVFYLIIPWAGLMMVGYGAGKVFGSAYTQKERFSFLMKGGLGLIAFFVVLRFTNLYGDPVPWSSQKNGLYTFLSFINVFKYPPSLLYMCITIGPAMIALAYLEKVKNRFTAVFSIFGRTAFFYYILHLYLIHFFSAISFYLNGHRLSDNIQDTHPIGWYFNAWEEGYDLPAVYGIWIVVIVLLYPVCRWYDGYKKGHPEKWWLSYL